MREDYRKYSIDNRPLERFDDDFFTRYSVRTDLALEATEVIVERGGPPEIPGVVVENESTDYANINRTRVETDAGARAIGKVKGYYVTIESGALREHNREVQKDVGQLIAQELQRFLKDLAEDDPVLVVGLGNWNATPDALGPRVINKLLVTRHLFTMAPPELRGGLRPVAALAPGVLGITGIETGETIQGVVDKIKPKLIICIDALASRSTERLCTTIQIADTGIHPGSGIGNVRMGITPQTMGVPVVAIGVPTVIHAVTLVSDGMEMISSNGQPNSAQAAAAPGTEQDGGKVEPQRTDGTQSSVLDPSRIRFASGTPEGAAGMEAAGEHSPLDEAVDARMQQLGQRRAAQGARGIDAATKRRVLRQLLEPYMGTLVVTPKEIDVLIDDAAWVVAAGLNTALHPGMDIEQAAQYTV
ncbi:MAG: GPR endopeptidase [Firmicutes bacterium]|nr:GPR endopeptidase [Bacillota bacterium]